MGVGHSSPPSRKRPPWLGSNASLWALQRNDLATGPLWQVVLETSLKWNPAKLCCSLSQQAPHWKCTWGHRILHDFYEGGSYNVCSHNESGKWRWCWLILSRFIANNGCFSFGATIILALFGQPTFKKCLSLWVKIVGLESVPAEIWVNTVSVRACLWCSTQKLQNR